ncbi:hypothetical protein LB941_02315 [Ligilactobacillus sp. WILCCON 0076]|uniref:Uncharacterized protein n=1 Tax=Ligilactobacillus ubinensis TaxID=2876789 RepID=A0A9X2JKL7_9LACO|nr:hypothetical protein [Ligilactobacillus ubinensis]MCP0886169.1 hypothetical protein [Ligilactobacillus ubinensis]
MVRKAYLIRSEKGYKKILTKLKKDGYFFENQQVINPDASFKERIVLVESQDKTLKIESIAKYNGDAMYTSKRYNLEIVD